RIALGGLVKGDLAQGFVDGDFHEELAQVVLLLENKATFAEAQENGPKHRLNDVLGIDPTGVALAEAPLSELKQAVHVAVAQLPRGILVAAAPEVDQGLLLR